QRADLCEDAVDLEVAHAVSSLQPVAGTSMPSTVMIESQKASVAFRAATEVRNRLVNAYQEIMNMPI
ncbi:flagellar hook-basal body complex protein FliE, partial [bacterium]